MRKKEEIMSLRKRLAVLEERVGSPEDYYHHSSLWGRVKLVEEHIQPKKYKAIKHTDGNWYCLETGQYAPTLKELKKLLQPQPVTLSVCREV